MTNKGKPSIKLPSFTVSDNSLKTVLKTEGFIPDDNLVHEVQRFIHAVDFTVQVFKYNHHEINEPIIKEYNKKVRDLQRSAAEDIRNITSITIHTRRGAITFHNDALSGHLIKKLFGPPKPDMTINGDFAAQMKYAVSTELIMPLKEYAMPDKDQLFVSIVNDAIPLGKFMYGSYTKKKSAIQSLVLSLLLRYFPTVKQPEPDASKQTFKKHFNKYIG